MMTLSAKVALPIQRFSPLMTYSSPSRVALVSSATVSEPCVASVRPQAPIFSSRAIAGSHLRRCSSLPSMWMVPIASPEWTPRKVLRLPSPLPISMATIPAASWLIPGQP